MGSQPISWARVMRSGLELNPVLSQTTSRGDDDEAAADGACRCDVRGSEHDRYRAGQGQEDGKEGKDGEEDGQEKGRQEEEGRRQEEDGRQEVTGSATQEGRVITLPFLFACAFSPRSCLPRRPRWRSRCRASSSAPACT